MSFYENNIVANGTVYLHTFKSLDRNIDIPLTLKWCLFGHECHFLSFTDRLSSLPLQCSFNMCRPLVLHLCAALITKEPSRQTLGSCTIHCYFQFRQALLSADSFKVCFMAIYKDVVLLEIWHWICVKMLCKCVLDCVWLRNHPWAIQIVL